VIDEEVKRIVDEQYRVATALLREHRQALDAVAAALLKHETLSGDEVAAVLRGDDVDEFRQAQIRQQQAAERATKRPEPEVRPLPGVAGDKNPDVGLSSA